MTVAAPLAAAGAAADAADTAVAAVRRRILTVFCVLGAVLLYLAYAFVTFDVGGLIARSDAGRAILLGTDSVAHKVHVTADLRRGGTTVSVEGERTATWAPGTSPDWVTLGDDATTVDLGGGHLVTIEGRAFAYDVPGYGTVRAEAGEERIAWQIPDGPVPEWVLLDERKVEVRPSIGRRVQITRTRIEVHRYFAGWENFFFPFNSPLRAYSAGELFGLALSDERIDPAQSNLSLIATTFWRNPDWQHGHVFVALLETILMAVLGTMIAALLGLPLAFIAARNFTPSRALQFAVRRLLDFVRGVDSLIWSLVLIRAFGLGPLTGALAIGITDTGTLGKLFSEALENVDNRQVEGVRATGASQLQRYRYGVIPQIMPVFLSQVLYYLESNTRSATVIGALGAGGIGLVLVETIRTSRDWENTLYIIILTVLVVMLMDQLSTWLRRRLITGSGAR